MIKKGDKVYLVKYALSDGITCEVVAEDQEAGGDFLRVEGRGFFSMKIGRDVFTDPQKAVATAEEMRAKKIKSIEKQLASLKNRRFSAQID